MKLIDKAILEINATRKDIVKNYCPNKFGLKDLKTCNSSSCITYEKCIECWNREVEE